MTDERDAADTGLTLSQTLIWTGQALDPTSARYNEAWRFDIAGRLDPDLFAAAVDAVARGSDAMRTVVRETPAGPVATVLADPPVRTGFIDLSGHADPAGEAERNIAERIVQPFDLGRATWSSTLLKLSDRHVVWLLNQHHIATDAWSAALVHRAASEVYARLEAGEDVAIHRTPPFGDHVASEREAQSRGDVADARAYWAGFARDAAPNTPPYGRSRQARGSAAMRVPAGLGPERSARLRALARSPGFRALGEDAALFQVFAAVLAALLSRLGGDRTVTIGAPAHNRTTPTARATIGLFIEMYPLRVAVEPEDTFRSLHRRVVGEAQAWMRHARPGAGSAQTASLFNAVLNYLTVRLGPFAGRPATATWLHAGATEPAHDLRLQVHDFAGDGTLDIAFDVNRGIFDDALAAALPGHFLALLDAVLDDPDVVIDRVPLLSPAEADRLRTAVSRGPSTPQPPTVIDAFRRRAGTWPEAIAIRDGSRAVTYAEVDTASDAFAAALADAGVPAGGVVLLHGARSADLVIAWLGAFKAGACVAPVPADAPPGRLATIAAEADPVAVVVDAPRLGAAGALGRPILPMDARATPLDRRAVDAGAAAYCLFTSGSTGRPKGVVVEHGPFARYIDWACRSYLDGKPADIAFCTSIGFDLTLTSLFVPLVCGGAVVVYPETAGATDLAVLDAIADDRVDVVKLTPSHLALACEAGRAVARIRTLIVGGEALGVDLCQRTVSTLRPDLAIYNEYGPTEAVVGCMIHRFDPGSDRDGQVPIGRPADDVVIHVLDAGLNPVPVGVTGEIAIGGERLSRGYLGRPDLTAQSFVDDPFVPGRRLYRTGDLARVRADGLIDYLGRRDKQLKIGGVRIEPAEVEAALMAVPGITGAVAGTVATRRPRPRGEPRRCIRCGLGDDHPGVGIDADGVCSVCRRFDGYRDQAGVYFETPEALVSLVQAAGARRTGRFDVIMLLSGGKDSSYALYRLAEITPRILALTLDNGYISDGAKANIRRVTEDLGVEHRFIGTPAMDAVFLDSLKRHSNVCNGCFKVLYTLSMEIAVAEGVSAIVTGLSRGQFFETRLTPDLFEGEGTPATEIDRLVHEARRAYHRVPDAATLLVDAPSVASGEALERVTFIDIYRYLDVPLSEVYRLLSERAAWLRPDDTGRSTNCLINDVGIFVHKRREGFHNYALPYSWDVRMGHKTRDAALDELDDAIDPRKVQAILDRLGWDEPLDRPAETPKLVAWFTAEGPVDVAELRRSLAQRLPAAMVPTHLVQVDAIPLTANGKADLAALPAPRTDRPPVETAFDAPATSTERTIAAVWSDVLGVARVGALDNFYDLGGDSIAAIRIAAEARRRGVSMVATDLFEHQTVRALAARVTEDAPPAQPRVRRKARVTLGEEDLATLGRSLGPGSGGGG